MHFIPNEQLQSFILYYAVQGYLQIMICTFKVLNQIVLNAIDESRGPLVSR